MSDYMIRYNEYYNLINITYIKLIVKKEGKIIKEY